MSPPNAQPIPAWDAPLTWTCVACGYVHPMDHEGMFCGVCMDMACCIGCSQNFTGQCHADDEEDEDDAMPVFVSQALLRRC